MKKSKWMMVVCILLLLLLSGCAKPNTLENVPDETGQVSGFWSGLWDGLTSWAAFLLTVFQVGDYEIYASNNNGAGYQFGFLIGSGILFSLLSPTIDTSN